MTEKNRKLFVLDTNVLLYDKQSIHSFPNNDVVIPITVLDELDRFKEKTGVVGEAARYVNNGHPNPPTPIIKTFVEKIFF